MLPKRLHTFSKVLAISALSSCLPVMAQEKNGGQYDSLGSKSDATKPDAQRVYEVMLKMLDRWNAHDLEGHLEAYWKSPELLVVIDSEQFNGWQQLHVRETLLTGRYVSQFQRRLRMTLAHSRKSCEHRRTA